MNVVLVLALLAMADAEPAPVTTSSNRWAEPTRGILAQHCGRCHLPKLPTSVPRALAVFNLTEEPAQPDLYTIIGPRLRSGNALPS